MNSITQALSWAAAQGLDRLDGQLLLLHALATGAQDMASRRAWLLTHGEEQVPAAQLLSFEHSVQRRAAGEPLAYVTGHKEFFGLDLAVDARVLVPRPDTEVLVQWSLDVLAGLATAGDDPPIAILDLGTGSGAVALAIKWSRPDLRVDAVDASADALRVARANAQALGLDVRFQRGSWLEPITARYHCIVANPPYIAEGDPHLTGLLHEPHQALVSGPDGLKDITEIVEGAGSHLHAGGWLLIEHGYDQAASVRALMVAAGYRDVATRRDLAAHERCTGGRVIGDGLPPLMK